MANRKKKIKEEIRELARFGNFTVFHRKSDDGAFVRLATADGSWSQELREDTYKYSWLLKLLTDEKLEDFLHAWIAFLYVHSMCSPDPEYFEDIANAWNALLDRSVKAELSDKENENPDIE